MKTANNIIITTESLKKIGATKEAIESFEKNYPNGLDISKIEITGRYKYDHKGNVTKEWKYLGWHSFKPKLYSNHKMNEVI